MADTISPDDKQSLVSSFLEIAVGQTVDTARQFLQATSWKLEDAIQLYYVGKEGGIATSSSYVPPVEYTAPLDDQSSSGLGEDIRNDLSGQGNGDEVRPPLPVIRESLYGASRPSYTPSGQSTVVAFRNFEDEMRTGVWDGEQGSTFTTEKPQDNLAAMYRPPFSLMFQGSFEKAKIAAAFEDKWLLVNLQSNTEFSSHMLNRDTWGNEAVAQTIKSNFIFWQVYDETTEGKKVCTYYKVDSVPIVLIIDPITGQKMRSWSGMIHPDRLLEDLFTYMDRGPQNFVPPTNKRLREAAPFHPQKTQEDPVMSKEEDEELQQAIAFSMEDSVEVEKSASEEIDNKPADDEVNASLTERRSYPPLSDEPKAEKSLLCRIGFRLPDGRRVQRSFLRSDPLQMLWSFCYSQLTEDKERAFRLAEAIPGCSKTIEYDSTNTVGDSGLANSMILVTWE